MKSKDYPYLDVPIYDNFNELLTARYRENEDKTAIKYFENKEIKEISYKGFIGEIGNIYSYYGKNGINNKHIALFLENRYEYLVIYLASIFNNVAVPLDKEIDEDTLRDCLDRFDADMVVCSNKTVDKVKKAAGNNITILNIDSEYGSLINADSAREDAEYMLKDTMNTDKDRFAVLASSSGTDGQMKGVMLSQYNIIVNVRGTLENNVLGNPTFAFLPMNHTYGLNPCMLATFYNGTTLCLNLNMKYFMRDLKAFNPDFFGAVPLVIETIYATIQREAKKQKKEKTLKLAIALSRFLRWFHIDIRHKLFGNLICDNLTKIVNGGAMLSGYYVKKFDEIGIKILNGYGLTECSPTVAVSREYNNIPGSAGTIMKNIDVKIAEDGEILVAGPNVMLGYYKDEKSTKESMVDGYLKTGDIGYTVGRVLFVTGRKKNLIVLENGKKVPPEQIEEKLNVLPYIKDSLVVSGRNKKKNVFITALIRFSEDTDPETAVKQLETDIKSINSRLPSYMAIEQYEIMKEDFVKTSTQKIRRNLYDR